MEPIVLLISALLGAGGLTALIKARSDNKKTNAETEVTLGGGWKVLWDTARTETNELRERLAVIELSEMECKRRLSKLETLGGVEVEKTLAGMISDAIERREGDVAGGSASQG